MAFKRNLVDNLVYEIHNENYVDTRFHIMLFTHTLIIIQINHNFVFWIPDRWFGTNSVYPWNHNLAIIMEERFH